MDDAAHLFGAYFYEEWDTYEYASWEKAVDDFARRSPDRVAGAVRDLTSLMEQEPDSERLGIRLQDLGCAYAPPEGDREWIARVIARLQAGPGREVT